MVVRLRNRFNVSNYQKDRVDSCIRNAAGVGRDTAEEESICFNEQENVIAADRRPEWATQPWRKEEEDSSSHR
ncbi:hypothetical protein HPB50_016642 [Hyalomma asiaticum]|uniref:Uncharacterized protein n=1 Tax=Hyalomma asiaticum TaxID=266040 RepID=A0ACB7S9D7_HYAAI|nr:hypothetical protein HPB50_016642 [Hyalomma asiaticum]